ncbi:Squamosa promoter-binding-like protein [Pleodorina starrii]|nr:Squamosa promoter-binding-like protein [Pleodorina starrii]
MSVADFAHAQWAPGAYDWNPVTMEAYDTRGSGKRRKPGTSNCQAPGCTVDLSDAKPYFKRHCICATHMKAPQVWINGEKKRYCQQCGHFESLDLFIGANRSCKMSLDRRSAIAQASKQKGGGGRSARSRDQQVGREQSSASDNTSAGSDRGDGAGAKDSTWGSPAEMMRSETDMRAGLGGDQLCAGGRDVDMAGDCSSGAQMAQARMFAAPPPPRTASASTPDIPVLNLNPSDAFGNHRHLHAANGHLYGGNGNGNTHHHNHHHQQQPTHRHQDAALSLSSVGSIGLGGLNLNLNPQGLNQRHHQQAQGPQAPQHQAPASGAGAWPDSDAANNAPGAGLRFPSSSPSAAAAAAASSAAAARLYARAESHPALQQQPRALWEQRMMPAAAEAAAGGGGAARMQQYGFASAASGHVTLASPAPSGRLLAAAAAPRQLFSAAPPSVLGSLAAVAAGGGGGGGVPLPAIEDPGLEMQLQDILDSARLEGQGWFGGPTAAGAVQQPAAMAPKLSPYSAVQAPPLPGGGGGGSSALGASSLEAAMWYNAAGGGGGSAAAVVSSTDMGAASGAVAGDSFRGGVGGSSSLMTCMQYMQQQPPLPPQQQQQQWSPYEYGGVNGGGGGAVRPAAGLGAGAGATRELLSYRPGEPDHLVRMALKLTSRAPDELEPSTVASLRKMLSVYDRLQSVQGYVRPGCTQLVIDAHRGALGLGPLPGVHAAAAQDAAAAASPFTIHITGGGGGGGGGGASAGSSTSSSWWADDSSSCYRALGGRVSAVSASASASASVSGGGRSLASVSLSGLLLEAAAAAAGGAGAGGLGGAGGGCDPEALLSSPAVLAALRDIARGNETALTLQLEDVAISVGADGSLDGEVLPLPRRLTGLPTVIAASCAAVSADSVAGEVTLYGTHLDRPGVTFWARMHGVCYPLQYRICCGTGGCGVVVRLPLLPTIGLLQLEAVAPHNNNNTSTSGSQLPGGVGAVGPSYPLLVLPSAEAVAEVHVLAAAMGPASLRRFVADFGLVLGLGALLAQPLNGVTPVRGPTAAAAAAEAAAAAAGGGVEPLTAGSGSGSGSSAGGGVGLGSAADIAARQRQHHQLGPAAAGAAAGADKAAPAAPATATCASPSAASASGGTWGSTDSATAYGDSDPTATADLPDTTNIQTAAAAAAINAEPAPTAPLQLQHHLVVVPQPSVLLAAAAAAAAAGGGGSGSGSAAAVSQPRRRGGVLSRGSSSRGGSSRGSSGAGGEGGLLGGGGGDPTEAMTNGDDEEVVELLLGRGAVHSLLETSLALLQTLVDRRMHHCVALLVSRLCELHERFPDRLHSGAAPPCPPPGSRFGLMHSAARAGDVGLLGCLLSLEGLMGEHCSLSARGVNGVTPLHLMALLPQAPALMRSLQRIHPGVEQALSSTAADDGLTPLQLYHMMHSGGGAGTGGAGAGTHAAGGGGTSRGGPGPDPDSSLQTDGGLCEPSPPCRTAGPAFAAATALDHHPGTTLAAPTAAAAAETSASASAAAAAAAAAAVPADMLLAAAAAEAAAMGSQSEAWSAQGEAVAVAAAAAAAAAVGVGMRVGRRISPRQLYTRSASAGVGYESGSMSPGDLVAAVAPPSPPEEDSSPDADRSGGTAPLHAAASSGSGSELMTHPLQPQLQRRSAAQPAYATAPASVARVLLGGGGGGGGASDAEVPPPGPSGSSASARLVAVAAADGGGGGGGCAAASEGSQKGGPMGPKSPQPARAPSAQQLPAVADTKAAAPAQVGGGSGGGGGARPSSYHLSTTGIRDALVAAAADVLTGSQSEAWVSQGAAAAAAAAARGDGVTVRRMHPVGTRLASMTEAERAAAMAALAALEAMEAGADGEGDGDTEDSGSSACGGGQSWQDSGNSAYSLEGASNATCRSVRSAIAAAMTIAAAAEAAKAEAAAAADASAAGGEGDVCTGAEEPPPAKGCGGGGDTAGAGEDLCTAGGDYAAVTRGSAANADGAALTAAPEFDQLLPPGATMTAPSRPAAADADAAPARMRQLPLALALGVSVLLLLGLGLGRGGPMVVSVLAACGLAPLLVLGLLPLQPLLRALGRQV